VPIHHSDADRAAAPAPRQTCQPQIARRTVDALPRLRRRTAHRLIVRFRLASASRDALRLFDAVRLPMLKARQDYRARASGPQLLDITLPEGPLQPTRHVS
jgi:hypothetical protein